MLKQLRQHKTTNTYGFLTCQWELINFSPCISYVCIFEFNMINRWSFISFFFGYVYCTLVPNNNGFCGWTVYCNLNLILVRVVYSLYHVSWWANCCLKSWITFLFTYKLKTNFAMSLTFHFERNLFILN